MLLLLLLLAHSVPACLRLLAFLPDCSAANNGNYGLLVNISTRYWNACNSEIWRVESVCAHISAAVPLCVLVYRPSQCPCTVHDGQTQNTALYIYIYILYDYIYEHTLAACMRSMQRVNIMVLKFGWMPKDLNTSIQALARPQYSIAASSRALSIIIIIKIFIIFVAYLLLLPFDAINFSHCTDCGQSTACTVHTHTQAHTSEQLTHWLHWLVNATMWMWAVDFQAKRKYLFPLCTLMKVVLKPQLHYIY